MGAVDRLRTVPDEPRFWRGRVFTKSDPIVGVGFVFRCPYGVAGEIAKLLTRECSLGSITRFTFGPLPAKRLSALPRDVKNGDSMKYETVLEDLGATLAIDWEA